MNDPLHKYLSSCLQYQEDKVLSAFKQIIRSEFKDSINAIIFYGSSMRTHEYKDSVLDFYVVVDQYENAYSSRWHRFANTLLPPNVYYMQTEIDEEVYRSKYAVISKSALMRKVSDKAFHPYFWARFMQPIAYIYIYDNEIKNWMAEVQCAAIKTFYNAVVCTLGHSYDSKHFWVHGFELTYASELRTEAKGRGDSIYQDNTNYYDELFKLITEDESLSKRMQSDCKFRWNLRIWLGKVLSILRLAKATSTFANGADYIAWKIERHTGEKVEVTDRVRKYPWIFSWPILFKLIRDKSIR